MQGVRDYIKFIKRGYTRPSHLVAIDVRHGRLTKEQGEEMVREYEGRRPPSLDLFLQFVGLSEEEFLEVAMSHQVSPYRHDPSAVTPGEKMADFDAWDRSGAMSRNDADSLLQRWRARKSGGS